MSKIENDYAVLKTIARPNDLVGSNGRPYQKFISW